MINPLYSGFLVQLLTLLLMSWVLPLVRRGIDEDPWISGNVCRTDIATGYTLPGSSLLYTGAGMIMRLYQEMRSSCNGGTDMD